MSNLVEIKYKFDNEGTMIIKKRRYVISLIVSWLYGFFTCSILDMIKPIRASLQSVIRMPTTKGVFDYVVMIVIYAVLMVLLSHVSQINNNNNTKKFIITITIV